MPDDICILGHGNRRLERPAPAQDFYCSQWFRAARRYMESHDFRWYIAAPEYNRILRPHDEVEPRSTVGLTNRQLETWAFDIYYDLYRQIDPLVEYTVSLFMGQRYYKPLKGQFERCGIKVILPLAHYRIEAQISILTQWAKNPPEKKDVSE